MAETRDDTRDDDEAELACLRLLDALEHAEGIEFVSSRGAAALAAALARVLSRYGGEPGRARRVSTWLMDQDEVADLFVDDVELERALAELWDGRHAHRRARGPVTARHEELEALLVREPDSLDHQLVYGDWLQAQHDPFGELIARRVAATLAPDDLRLLADAEAYQREHAEHIFGRLAEYLDVVLHPTWYGGFLRAVRFGTKPHDPGPYQGAILLRWLLERRPALLLREIAIHPIDHHWGHDQHRELLAVLFERPRPLIRELRIVHDDGGDAGRLPDELAELLPGLERLEVSIRTANARVLDHPRLVTLIWSGFIGPDLTKAIGKAELPRLERLELGAEYPPTGLGPALAQAALPRLRHLRVRAGAALLRSILAADWHEQLESLDLSDGSLVDADAELLAGLAWPRLRHVDVARNHLGPAGVAALARVCPEVVADDQRRPGWEYDEDEDDEGDDDDDDGLYGDIRE